MKMLISQQVPAWVKPACVGVTGAAVAWLALIVNKHVSVSIRVH